MDINILKSYIPLYKDALFLTMKIGWQGIILSLILGLVGAAILHFRIPVLKVITGIYIEIFRNTPLLVTGRCAWLPQRWSGSWKGHCWCLSQPGLWARRLLS